MDEGQAAEILRLAYAILAEAKTAGIGRLTDLLAFITLKVQPIPVPMRAAVYRVIQTAAINPHP